MTGPEPSRYVSYGGELSLSGGDLLELVRAVTERGLPLRMRAYGSSMTPLIRGGDVVTIAPLSGREPRVGEVIAFVSPRDAKLVVHRVVAREGEGLLLRGDNRRVSDGVVVADGILGSVARVERHGRDVDFGTGLAGTGIAWMSRSGVMTVIQSGRRLIRRLPAVVLRSAQGMAWYRAVGRRLVPGFDIEAASATDGEAVRRHLARGNTDSGPAAAPDARVTSWVAKRKDRITGVVQLVDVRDSSSPWAGVWLASLAVEGRRRGLGIGEALTRRALGEAAQLELPRILAVIEEDNDRGLCLLAKLGFVPVAINALEPGLAAEGALSGRRHLVLGKELRGGVS